MRVKAKINGKTVPVQYYEPGKKTVQPDSVFNLGDIGELGRNLLGRPGVGLGALGIAPLVAAGWGLKVLLVGGAAYLGYNLYSSAKETLPENIGKAIRKSFPYLGGAVVSNYVMKYAVPPKFKSIKWIPTTVLAGIGTYKLISEMTTKQRDGIAPDVITTTTTDVKIPPPEWDRLGEWQQIRDDIEIAGVKTTSGNGIVKISMTLKNISARNHDLMVVLTSMSLDNAGKVTGDGKIKAYESKQTRLFEPRWVNMPEYAKNWFGGWKQFVWDPVSLPAYKSYEYNVTFMQDEFYKLYKQHGRLFMKFLVFAAMDKNETTLTYPIRVSGMIPMEPEIT